MLLLTFGTRNEQAQKCSCTHDPSQALTLVDKALKSDDKTPWEFVHTCGVILFRLGRWDDAIEALGLSMKMRKGGDPNEWFFLAMAEFRRGHEDEARAWYDRSLVWLGQLKHRDPDLDSYRAETEALLGIKPEASTTRNRRPGGSLGAWRTGRSWPTMSPRV